MKTKNFSNIQENDNSTEDIDTENEKFLSTKRVKVNKRYIKQIKEESNIKVSSIRISSKYENILGEIKKNLNKKDTLRCKEVKKTVQSTRCILDNFIFSGNLHKMEQTNIIIENIINDIITNNNYKININELKQYDDATYTHVLSVTVLTLYLGKQMNLNKSELTQIALGGLFHDLGKLFIPIEILNKPGRLTNEEFDIIKKHPTDGFILVKDKICPLAADIVLSHHEKFDGTGYPHKKKGKDISLFARMTAISDVYDAVTADRPYRKGMQPNEALELIMGSCGSHFDPEIVDCFIRVIAAYPNGSIVELSNSCKAMVMEQNKMYPLRPKLLVFEEKGKVLKRPIEVDLEIELNIVITNLERTSLVS